MPSIFFLLSLLSSSSLCQSGCLHCRRKKSQFTEVEEMVGTRATLPCKWKLLGVPGSCLAGPQCTEDGIDCGPPLPWWWQSHETLNSQSGADYPWSNWPAPPNLPLKVIESAEATCCVRFWDMPWDCRNSSLPKISKCLTRRGMNASQAQVVDED